MRLRARTPVGLVTAGLLLTACTSGGKDGPVVTVTVPPSPASSPSSSSGAPSGTSASTSSGTSASPSASATALPGTCDSLLADFTVTEALGNVTLDGTTAFVVGVPDPKIGRLSTINCRYGVTGTGATAKTKVEIGVSLYATAAQAQTRVSATESDYTSRGATGKDVTLPAASTTPPTPAATGRYLSGAVGTGYDLPLLVVASDRRTVAVTVDPAAVPSPPAEQAATKLAQVALQRTAV